MATHPPVTRQIRRGFTLVEMLVVIFIIGILAALLLPAIIAAVRRGQIAANGYEIGQLKNAVETYFQEKGDYPPTFEEDYSNNMTRDNTVLGRHLTKCYPKMTAVSRDKLFQLITNWRPTPDQALVAWLSQTGGNPRDPFGLDPDPMIGGMGDRKIYYEFDERRLVAPSNTSNPFRSFKPKYAKDSYYYLFDSRTYSYNDTRAGAKPYYKSLANGNTPTEAINATTYQIVCAGLDGEFGGENASSPVRKGWAFGNNATAGTNTFPEDNDNQTSFSEGKTLKDILP